MGKWELYWLEIAKDIKHQYGHGHPSKWEETAIEEFLLHFEKSVRNKLIENDQLAHNCGIRYKGLQIDNWKSMVPSNFRKIFSYRNNTGKTTTRNAFAIYFGYDSAEDYISKKGLNELTTIERELPLFQSEDNQHWSKKTLDVSRKFLAKCLELRLDAALISEAKRVVNTELEIFNAKHIVTIDGTTVHMKAIYRGRNSGNIEKHHFHFNPVAAVPCYPAEMNAYAKDLNLGKMLSLSTEDDELNNAKNYQLYFSDPLPPNGHFHIELGYSLIQTAKLEGNDYLFTALSFDRKVWRYDLQISFSKVTPKELRIVNSYENHEESLEPIINEDNVIFTYSLDDSDCKALNNTRLLMFFER